MKKALLALLVVALVATASNAAVLSMKWAGTDDQLIQLDPTGATAPQTATIEIWLDLLAGDDVINYFGANEDAPELLQTGVTTGIPGWVDASTDTHLGQLGQQVSVGTPGAQDPISGGLFHIADQTVLLDGGVLDQVIDVTFDHPTVGILDLTGGAYTHAPAFIGILPHTFRYGTGSPGVDGGAAGVSPRDPLQVQVVPEPASLALLALGGFALLRRR